MNGQHLKVQCSICALNLDTIVELIRTVGHMESEACGRNNLCLGEETHLSRLA
jgi:hypothetical protein